MVAVTPDIPAAHADEPFTLPDDAVRSRHTGVVPTASMVTGAALGVVWFWIPLTILIIGVSSIPSVVGFVLATVVFVYLMRGVERVERVRSEAVFALGIAVPPRKLASYTGFQRWAHQIWLDASSARFWKAVAHHYLRLSYDMLATGLALALLAFAFIGPAVATAISRSDAEAGLWFISPPVAWLLAVVALAAAVAIAVFAPTLDASIDRWLLSPSATAALQHEVSALSDARQGAGGTVLDPEVVSQILVRSRQRSALDALTPRELEVLQLMAEGRANSAIASALHVSVGSAEKHIASIFAKLNLAPDESENRRVLAVLRTSNPEPPKGLSP